MDFLSRSNPSVQHLRDVARTTFTLCLFLNRISVRSGPLSPFNQKIIIIKKKILHCKTSSRATEIMGFYNDYL